MYRIIYLAMLIVGVAALLGENVQSYRWPTIAPAGWTFRLSGSPIRAQSVTISGPSGNPLYWLGCHGGFYEESSGDPDHDDQEYWGDLDCHLHPLYPPADGNLFIADAFSGTEHFSRPLASASDLEGACAKYPEWGALRHVSVRGMAFTFKYSNAVILPASERAWDDPNKEPILASVALEIKVEPDPHAVSAIALEAAFDRPRYPVSGNQPGISPLCDRLVSYHIPGVDIGGYVRERGLGPPYARVAPVEKSATFALVEEKDWQVPILDIDGKEVYSLKCRAGLGEAGLDRWGVSCKLFQAGKDLDLLADSVDPYSRRIRTLFEPEQLEGKCSEYPEWGALRTFKLRGFGLVMRVKNVLLGRTGAGHFGFYKGPIARFDLAIKVVPDASAAWGVALPSRYVDWRFLSPSSGCEQVIVEAKAPAAE
jgi:hypothetical protein